MEAVRRGWLDVGELPVAAGIRARKPTENLDPLLELSPGQLLGRAADVDGAGGSGGARRAVDRNRDLLPRFQVARMPGLMSRNPVEVAAVERREPDGGDPRVPGGVGSAERHVLRGVDDGSCEVGEVGDRSPSSGWRTGLLPGRARREPQHDALDSQRHGYGPAISQWVTNASRSTRKRSSSGKKATSMLSPANARIASCDSQRLIVTNSVRSPWSRRRT